ncbi:uncharacterized protein SPPG_02631 [Spizellomyces punctatus DAOM BR117]|uniref:DUF676 domain-containing protein n=1 Tax=Spizellomyces punctatus (strain DAOM BR117) TaxID=645134 RepID=A0A0L0HM13_SPIPD|nr:uncharacterized protein SPPG_02631 [Spizellomyces punctatus DAOM BR117]KND02137.1 hypothetical protein SPPG_02631 [Spizellomyces punctatus DAOM BR117]|eukprot:XP_016610176.1 hypothetical protein SPPG_02631 [Spizellomyces punctatus DAOM BR117]
MHLIVLHHGLWGKPSHLSYLENSLRERFGDEVQVLNFGGNAGNRTYDGIDICGERLARTILECLSKKSFDRISFIGYSLGGLIIRYAVGILEARHMLASPTASNANAEEKLCVRPVNFITVATPHAGASLRPDSTWARVYNMASALSLSKSGSHMMLTDRDGVYLPTTGCGEIQSKRTRPLLDAMADPDLPFWQGLQRFQVRKVFANTINDRVVNFTSSSLEETNHYRRGAKWVVCDAKYPSIVKLVGLTSADVDVNEALVQEGEAEEEATESIATEREIVDTALGATTVAALAATAATAPAAIRKMLFYVLLPVLVPLALMILLAYYAIARTRHITQGTFRGRAGNSVDWILQYRPQTSNEREEDHPGGKPNTRS